MKSFRLILLLVTGAGIAALAIWREQQLGQWRERGAPPRAVPRQLAPRFELADQHRHLVKFERFLGRQRVLLLFLDGQTPPLEDPRLKQLWDNFEQVKSAGIEVVAVGSETATPFAVQSAEKELGQSLPFPLTADLNVNLPVRHPVHREWGCLDPVTEAPVRGLYVVARDGTVPVSAEGLPLPVEDEARILSEVCAGRANW